MPLWHLYSAKGKLALAQACWVETADSCFSLGMASSQSPACVVAIGGQTDHQGSVVGTEGGNSPHPSFNVLSELASYSIYNQPTMLIVVVF